MLTTRILTALGGRAFTPLSLAPAAWYAADLSSLITTSGGSTPATADADPVGKWTDLSGNSRSPVQATAGKRMTLQLAVQNGRNIVRSDGTQWLQYGSGTGCTNACHWFIVTKPTGTSSVVPLGVGTSVGGQLFTAFFNGNFIAAGGPGADTDSGIAASTTAFKLYSASYDGTTARTWVNGVAGATGAVSVTMAGTIGIATNTDAGGGQLCAGDYCEILLFNRALSAAERILVETWLNQRWGLF